MLTTEHLPGAPCWLDLGSPDLDATASFYNGLFGWRFRSAGPDARGYGFFQLDGKTVAAAGPQLDEGASPAWMLYFATPDADAVAKAVEQAGGTVRVRPQDIGGETRMAQFTDPAGAEFAALQGGQGFEMVDEAGALCWSELLVPEPGAVREFYGSVFGWRIEDMAMGDISYTTARPPGGDENSAHAGIVRLEPGDRAHWLPYFEVTRCDAVVAIARQLGGTVVAPAADLAGVGRWALLADPHGARFAVITSSR